MLEFYQHSNIDTLCLDNLHVVIVASHGANETAVLPVPYPNGLVIRAGQDPWHLNTLSCMPHIQSAVCQPHGERTLFEHSPNVLLVSRSSVEFAETKL
jgi:hypothetical protein